jgi:glucose-1-phosphate thymidylyltransferase
VIASAILVAGVHPEIALHGDDVDAHERIPGLIPVLDRPLVAHAVDDLAAAGVERVVVLAEAAVADLLKAAVDDHAPAGVRIEVAVREPEWSLLTAVARARPRLDYGPFILRFADCLGDGDLVNQLRLHEPPGECDAVVLTGRFESPNGKADAGVAVRPAERSEFHVGVYLLGSGFPIALSDEEIGGSTSPLEAALTRMESRGGRVERRIVGDWWRPQGRSGACLAANRFALGSIREPAVAATVIDSDVDGIVRAHPTARIESGVIRGPVAIGPEAVVKDAYIGPFTAIGSGVRIEGAEVENSVVLEGSVVSGVGPRIDSSVIGPRASVVNDFRIPRGTRINVGCGASVSF